MITSRKLRRREDVGEDVFIFFKVFSNRSRRITNDIVLTGRTRSIETLQVPRSLYAGHSAYHKDRSLSPRLLSP